MINIIKISVLAMIISMPSMVTADDFGARFQSQTPNGLGEYTVISADEIPDIAMDDVADELQDIMPAAGEEKTSVEGMAVEPSNQLLLNITHPAEQ